ncbi:hypothetical protein LSAT2_031868, partial [Lamellibrachia satsuma]
KREEIKSAVERQANVTLNGRGDKSNDCRRSRRSEAVALWARNRRSIVLGL